MDRFIGCINCFYYLPINLKSNMDRFIEAAGGTLSGHNLYLKSNMDRFIVNTYKSQEIFLKGFKIQYG